MIRVLTAAPAKLTELQPIRSRLFVLGSDVVAALAFRALKYNVVARHKLNSPNSKSNVRQTLVCRGITTSPDI